MELGGFEPPTSWVRSGRSLATGILKIGAAMLKTAPLTS